MNVQQRIEMWAGEVWDPPVLYQLLQEAVREVIWDVSPDALTTLWSEETDSGAGVDTTEARVIEARKGLYDATQISPSYRTSEYITEVTPVTYTMGGKTYVLPDGGTVLVVSPPTVKLSDSAVTGVPDGLLSLFALKAAQRSVEWKMTRERDGVEVEITLPTAPTSPAAPSISYVDAITVAPSATSIAALISPPSYISPSIEALGAAPVVGTLDLTKKVDGVTSLVSPTPPSAPAINFTDALAFAPTAATIGALGAAPTYLTPQADALGVAPTVGTLDLSSIVVPTAPSAPAISYSDAFAYAPSATSIGSLGAAPTYITPSADALGAAPTVGTLDLTTKVDDATPLASPTPPLPPVISYADAAAVAPSASTIAALPPAPAFVPPALAAATTPPVVGTLDLTKKVDGVTSLDAPVAPTLDPVVYIPGVSETIASTSIDALPVPPTFIPPPFEGNIADITSGLADLTVSATAPTVPTAPTLVYIPAESVDAATQTVTAPSPVPTFTAPLLTLDWADFETYGGAEEDPEIMNAYVNRKQTEIQEYRMALDAAANAWQNEIEQYRASLQENIEEARLAQQTAIQNAALETDVNIKNATLGKETEARIYEAEIRGYEGEVAGYQAEVQAEIQEYLANLQQRTEAIAAAQRAYLAKYQSDIQAQATGYQGDLQDHMREIDRVLEQARLDQERLIQQARQTTDASLQNAIQEIQAGLQQWQVELQQYKTDAEVYAIEVKAVVDQFAVGLQIEAQVYQTTETTRARRYEAEIQGETARWQAANVPYMAEVENARLQAQILRSEAEQTAQQSTQVDLQNRAQEVAAQAAQWEAALNQYQADLTRYQQDVAAKVAQFETGLRTEAEVYATTENVKARRLEADVNSARTAFEAELSVYQATLQREIAQAQIARSEAEQAAAQQTQADVQNRMHQMAALIADWQADLELFQSEIALYQAEVAAAVEEFGTGLRVEAEVYATTEAAKARRLEADVASARTAFEAELSVYQATLQRQITQAQIARSEAEQSAAQSTSVDAQNRAQKLAADIADWQADLNLFQATLGLYQADVEAVVRQYETGLRIAAEVYSITEQTKARRFEAEVGGARAAFDAEFQEYRADLEKKIAQAQITAAEARQTAQQATDVALQNAAQQVAGAVAAWQSDLELFRADVEIYAAKVRALIEQQQVAESVRANKLRMFASDRDRLRRQYETSRHRYEKNNIRHRPINVQHVEY